MPTRKRMLGDLEGATRLVWKALKRAAQLLDDRDPQVALKAAHAAWPGQNAPSLEAWLVERLAFLEEAWPGAQEVELLGVWAGNPPRLEPIARARVKRREEVGA